MAQHDRKTTRSSKTATAVPADGERPDGFDILHQQVIGHVSFGAEGDLRADEAAMVAIARHGEEGTYSFIGPDEGSTVRVEITHVQAAVESHELAAFRKVLARMENTSENMGDATQKLVDDGELPYMSASEVVAFCKTLYRWLHQR